MIINQELISYLKTNYPELKISIFKDESFIKAKVRKLVSRCDIPADIEIYLSSQGFFTMSCTFICPLGIKKEEYKSSCQKLNEKEDTTGTFIINKENHLVLVWLDEYNKTLNDFKLNVDHAFKEINGLKLN